jgi:hypothetical protein
MRNFPPVVDAVLRFGGWKLREVVGLLQHNYSDDVEKEDYEIINKSRELADGKPRHNSFIDTFFHFPREYREDLHAINWR